MERMTNLTIGQVFQTNEENPNITWMKVNEENPKRNIPFSWVYISDKARKLLNASAWIKKHVDDPPVRILLVEWTNYDGHPSYSTHLEVWYGEYEFIEVPCCGEVPKPALCYGHYDFMSLKDAARDFALRMAYETKPNNV